MPHFPALQFALIVSIAGVAEAQAPAAQPLPGSVTPPFAAPAPYVWNPAADYVTPGQDEPGYRSWYLSAPRRAAQVASFNRYLATYEVGGVVPTWQLLRTASQWRRCGAQPFEVPPTTDWPNLVQTLRYIRDYVIPAVGPVEPVSAYRNPLLNSCSGGVPGSAHQHFQAVDLVPLRPTTRAQLMERLCGAHLRRGSSYQVGLGFYAFLRFHVDSMRFRKWGTGEAPEASPCRTTIVSPPAKAIDMPIEASPTPTDTAAGLAVAPAPPDSAQPALVEPIPSLDAQ